MDASARPAGAPRADADDDEAVQLFARPSAKQLKRRQQQQQQSQAPETTTHPNIPSSIDPSVVLSSKRARTAADVGGGGGGRGRAPPAAIQQHQPIAPPVATDADSFEQLGVTSWLCSVLRTLGITRPTPVQAACIPAILAGRDAVGLAQTGSGKTAAFALPALQALSREGPYGVFALVLTPTRELAFQLADQFRAFGAGTGLRDAVVVGGLDARAQAAGLARRPHVVVATPGRLAELLRQDAGLAAGFARVRFLVLDEADRLLDASFEGALRAIVAALPRTKAAAAVAAGLGEPGATAAAAAAAAPPAVSRQTLLFSATATRALLRLQEAALPDALVFSAYDAERRRQKQASGGGGAGDGDGAAQDAAAAADAAPRPSLAALAALDEGAVSLPEHLKQEYAFVPARVKDVYLAHVLEEWLGLGAAAERQQQLHEARQQKQQQQRRRGGGGGGGGGRSAAPGKDKSKGAAAAAAAAASLPNNAVADGRSAIVFAGTCRGCRLLELLAAELGVRAAALHARKPQRQRLAALAAFRSGAVPLLFATDVASRGLDIPHVGLVINYDLPALPRDYVHRVGRTARAGRSGRALSLVSPSDVSRLQAVEALTGRALVEAPELAGPEAEQAVLRGITRVFGARRAALMALAEEDDALAETLERRRDGWRRGLGGSGGGDGGEAAGGSKARRAKKNKGAEGERKKTT
jgi:ATP-dependent RNA helicase DDX49/DBP8